MIINYIESHIPHTKTIQPTSPSELKNIIRTLPIKKSPGPDLIPNIVLKNLSRKCLAYIASLFNACLMTGYFPKQWKTAHILLFNKPGKNKHHITSYRPISLLNTFSKLLEKVVYKRLKTELDILNALPTFQFGFRKGHSTIQQLARISELIEQGFENKLYTAIAFLDIAQAFDKVWIEGLKYKLLKLGLPQYITAIIFSFLEDRTFSVRINNCKSALKNIKAGVPQGSILGPVLFLIFVADIPTCIATLAMFADDTALIIQNFEQNAAIKELQNAINIVTRWLNKWNIKLNAAKCEYKIFALRRIRNPPCISINNQQIECNSTDKSVRYLGVHLDTRLTWSTHINTKLQQAYRRLQQLYPVLNRKSSLQTKCALLLYTSLLRPLLTYACEVWGNTSKTNLNKIQVFQNKVLRIAVNAPWFVRNEQLQNELSIPPIAEFIKKTTKRFLVNLKGSENTLAHHIGQTKIHSRIKRLLPQDIYLTDSDDE